MLLRNSSNSHRRTRRASTPSGFTLVELLVALLLLDVGLLGLVGIAAALYRDGSDTRATARAWAVASSRVERMASVACAGPIAGTATSDRVSEWFTEAATPNDTRLIADSVRVATSRGVQVAAIRTSARC